LLVLCSVVQLEALVATSLDKQLKAEVVSKEVSDEVLLLQAGLFLVLLHLLVLLRHLLRQREQQL
jgi:hypothetical protein